jgi:hypothetical protein
MKSFVFIFLLTGCTMQLRAQSICDYLCNDQTYISSDDGSTITFYNNGNVALDGKVNPAFSYQLLDCTVTLYFNKKEVNTLIYSDGTQKDIAHFNGLIDKRNIRYVHLKASLGIQVLPESK